MTEIGSTIFTQTEINAFAMASGDYNPVHVDPETARRLITGGTVVHGMYTLLWMIERYFESGGADFAKLVAYFPRPVKPGDVLTLLRSSETKSMSIHLHLAHEGETVATVLLENGEIPPISVASTAARPDRAAPDELCFAALKGLSGQTLVASASADMRHSFVQTVCKLGEIRVEAIMALSRLVGMQAPGLHSIFTGLTLAFDHAHLGQTIDWQVSRASVPIAPVRIAFRGGGFKGHVDAIVRPAAVEQPQMQALEAVVTASEFSGQHALVVGGSRGLGELVAKLVAAGGGQATISYLTGETDAQRVVSEITLWGGKCSAIRLDIADADALASKLGSLDKPSTHVYYFPTPRIVKRSVPGFDIKAFTRYANIYVTAFDRLISALTENNSEALRIFYPSTSFIDELPAGFAEYAAAKAAGEVHCAYLNRTIKSVAIQLRRLPRLATDQTASLIPPLVSSTLAAMLETVRGLHEFAKPDGQAHL